jgi:hypothetical protein
VVIDFAVAQQLEQAFNFLVRDGPAQANVIDIRDRHKHRRLVRQNSEVEKTASSTENSLLFDLLDDPESMIRVDDLVTDLKSHVPLVSIWW